MARLTIELNNNPGALEDGDFARAQPGYVGGGGRFAKFATTQDGIRAQERLLAGPTYAGKGLTPRQILDRYTPPSRENSPQERANYLQYIATQAGVHPDKPIDRNKIPAFAKAMREFETGKGKKPMSRADSFYSDIYSGLHNGEPYSPGTPSDAERNYFSDGPTRFGVANPGSIDQADLANRSSQVTENADNVAAFLKSIVEPIRQNAEGITRETESVARTKHNLADDIQQRADALLEKMKPWQERRAAIMARVEEINSMSPLERALKKTFNPDYDMRVLEGRLARTDAQIDVLNQEFKEVNTIKQGVAALMVEADAADVDVLSAKSNELVGQAKLLGQVGDAIRNAADLQFYPLQVQFKALEAQETGKAKLLATMSTAQVADLHQRSIQTGTNTIEVDGLTFTTGELESASMGAQQRDISFRSMKNAIQVNDLQLADTLESQFIDRMTPEQIDKALKDGGKWEGQQLSIAKLTDAFGKATQYRTAQITEVIQNSTVGALGSQWRSLGQSIRGYAARAQDMFGSTPNELGQFSAVVQREAEKFQRGLEDAKSRGVEKQYMAQYGPVIAEMQSQLDTKITEIANRWGGGKKELAAVAEAYFKDAPISGDMAMRGLITIARSGMPAGARLEGPAAAALQAVESVVRDYDSPTKQGQNASLESILSPQKKSEADLLRKAQDAARVVYADHLTNELFAAIPQMARTVRDEDAPGKTHPFARVSARDFQNAVRHGDHEGYEVIANQLDITPQQVLRLFREGPDGQLWQKVAQAKGLPAGSYADLQAQLQAVQMAALLQALDSGPASRDGFKAGAAFVDFMQSKEVSAKVDEIVNSYGRSGFGAFIVSSSAGGGYRDSWAAYGDSLATTYQGLNAKELRQQIEQQRSLFGDPYARMNSILSASGLSAQERVQLTNAIRAVAPMASTGSPEGMGTDANRWGQAGLDTRILQSKQFDQLAYVLQNQKFEDPAIEKIRQKAAKRWDEMNSVISLIEQGQ